MSPPQENRGLWSTGRGGLATVILTEVFSDGEFESFLENLFHDVAPGDRFILWFGDNVPTDTKFERIQRIADFWKENSAYPLSS